GGALCGGRRRLCRAPPRGPRRMDLVYRVRSVDVPSRGRVAARIPPAGGNPPPRSMHSARLAPFRAHVSVPLVPLRAHGRHPARLSGRDEVVRHVTWFLGAVENSRFFDATVHPFADPGGAVAEVKAEALIKATGHTYRQEYVVFLRAVGGRIAFLHEYLNPARAAKALERQFLISNPDLP